MTLDKQSDNTVRFSLFSVLAVFGYISLSLAIASSMKSVALGIHLSLILVGWIMWRYTHGHLGGIVPALLGGDVLLCLSVPWIFRGAEDLMGFRELINVAASLLVVLGLVVLLWIGAKKQRFWQHQLWIAGSIFCVLLLWWIAIPIVGNAAIARRQAGDIAANSDAAGWYRVPF